MKDNDRRMIYNLYKNATTTIRINTQEQQAKIWDIGNNTLSIIFNASKEKEVKKKPTCGMITRKKFRNIFSSALRNISNKITRNTES